MPFPSIGVVRTCLFITAISITAVNSVGSGERRFDVRIGFDLVREANGAPSLRIRNFEDSSEQKLRANEESNLAKETKPTVRADSVSGSEEFANNEHQVKRDTSNDSSGKSDDDDDDDYSDEKQKLSTRGLKPGDYEPEENPRVHDKFQGSDEDSDRRRRQRRHALYRRKGKRE